MRAVFDAVFEFLLKYPPRVFERGTLVWQQSGGMRLAVPALVAMGALAWTYVGTRGRTRPAARIMLGTIRLAALALLLAGCAVTPQPLAQAERERLGLRAQLREALRVNLVDALLTCLPIDH